MTKKSGTSKGSIVITITIVVIFMFVFAIAFVVSSTSVDNTLLEIDEDTYQSEVDSALEGADPTVGEQLVQQASPPCVACHALANGEIAPLFVGIGNRAADRHPPLSAEQYLYESIMFPGSFVVEGFAPSMPINYGDLLTQQDIGHIIAYLMTLTEEPAS